MRGAVVAFLLLAVFPAWAIDLSGAWSSSLSLSNDIDVANTLTLKFSLSGWEIRSFSTFRDLNLSDQAFVFRGTLGNVNLSLGLHLKPVSQPILGVVSAQPFALSQGFASFELKLGNFTLGLTLIFGPEK